MDSDTDNPPVATNKTETNPNEDDTKVIGDTTEAPPDTNISIFKNPPSVSFRCNSCEKLYAQNNLLQTQLNDSIKIAKQILSILNQDNQDNQNIVGGVNPHLTDFLKHFVK